MSHSTKLNENSKAKNVELQAKNSTNSGETSDNKMSAEDATNEFFGYLVQLDCGDDGKYKGFITEVLPATNGTSAWGKVKLEKPLRDEVPFGDEDMAIMVPGEIIQEIKVLFMPEVSTTKLRPVKTLPQKSKSNLSGFLPVKKAKYTPKTSSTSLNKSNLASKFTKVHPPFNLLPKNSPSNTSISRRPPSVAQSLLKMKPPVVHDTQILSNIKSKQQMRANAKPFIPRILERPKKILSITPPPDKEKTTTSMKSEQVISKINEQKKEGKKERDEKKPKNSKKGSNKPEADETKEKKKSKQSIKEKGMKNIENGEERVKQKKKKPIVEEGETSSKMKGGKDERNRLAKEKRASKNADEKIKKNKDKEEKKDERLTKDMEEKQLKNKDEEKPAKEFVKEEEKPLNEKAKEQIEEEINQVEEHIVETTAEEIVGNNKLEDDEMLVTEEQLRNEVAEILENVATGIDNMTIDNIDDLNEAETNTSSLISTNRMTSSNEEQQLDDEESEPMRAEEFVDMLTSINTDAGIYQGIVAEVDPINRTMKLEKALLNGYPLGTKFIELESSTMKNITIFGNGNGSNNCYSTPKRNMREWSGKRGGSGCSCPYSPSAAVNNRPYSPNFNKQQNLQSPPQPRDQQFPLNTATMSNQVFMRSMPQPADQKQSIDYQQQLTTIRPIADGEKRRNFGKNNNRQSPTKPAAEWSNRQSPRTFIRRSVPPTSSTPPAQLAHEAYGDYKKFIQPQVPTPPARPRINNNNNITNNSLRHCGPTGIPAMDCMNGYSEVLNSGESTILNAPLDHAALNIDFDFASNLALFDKKEFVKKTEHTFSGLNTGGNNSRNYRNDENVLIDPSRVTSWVSSPSTSTSNWLYGQPSIAAGQNSRDNHHRMQQQYPRSKPSTKTE